MSMDMLPNNAGPVQRQMAAEYAARRARLFAVPVVRAPVVVPAPVPVPVVEIIPEHEPEREEQLTAAQSIMRDACRKHGLTMEELRGTTRRRDIVHARQECFYRMRTEVTALGRPLSLPRIARLFGRDHSTIVHGIERHAQRMVSK